MARVQKPSDKAKQIEISLPEKKVKAGPYVTGFCNVGAHEGASARAADGKTMLTNCRHKYYIQGKYYTCECSCHAIFRQLEEMTGMKVVQQVIPEPLFLQTEPAVTGLERSGVVGALMADHDARDAAPSLLGPVIAAPDMRRTFIGPPRGRTAAEQFERTDSGERARGQLEAEVAEAMWKWFQGRTDPFPEGLPKFTPDAARLAIKTEPTPSQGAVRSVFLRWETQAWVVLGQKPFCVLNPTERGLTALARWKP